LGDHRPRQIDHEKTVARIAAGYAAITGAFRSALRTYPAAAMQ
jgi:hypothetical protein